jgi:hypothetical protein
MNDDTLIFVVGSFVTLMAVWGLVVYFIVLFRERYAEVDPDSVQILDASPEIEAAIRD